MRRFLSYSASSNVTSFALLILRIGFGGLLITHGYAKMVHFSEYSAKFLPFLGMSPSVSLALSIFAEFFCAVFVVMGLFTRFAAIPIIINLAVALYIAHGGEILGKGEMATLYLLPFVALLFTGAGKFSIDGAIYKH